MKYKLIWSDEFDYQGKPDSSKWTHDIGGHGWGNKESQFYVDDERACYVQDGKLVIKAFKEKKENCDYISAKIKTYGKFSMQYGRVEVKAKLPKGSGTWPAIWFLGNSIKEGSPWPLCGEIDLMEYVGKDPNKLVFSLHTKAYNHRLNNHRTKVVEIEGISDRFVEYAMNWEKDYIEFFVDGESVVRFNRGERSLDHDVTGWPFDQPFYLILNLAIGGTWGGKIDDSIFPVAFEIEYVRVYEIDGDNT